MWIFQRRKQSHARFLIVIKYFYIVVLLYFSVMSIRELFSCKAFTRFVSVVSGKITKLAQSYMDLGFPSRHDPLCLSVKLLTADCL